MSALALQNFSGVSITISPDAQLAKQQALDGARAIVAVTDAATQQAAVDALARCRRFTKKLEAGRKEVKDPVIKLGKEIDGMAKDFAAEVEAEDARLDDLIQTHAREEAKRAAEAQRMRDQIAARKLEREREAERAAEAERARLEAEAKKATSESEAAMLAHQAAEAERAAQEARERAENVSASVVAAPAKADGMIVKRIWKHRVTDIHALYKARPDLVTLEPKTNAINTAIRVMGAREIPGLEIFEEIDTTVRS